MKPLFPVGIFEMIVLKWYDGNSKNKLKIVIEKNRMELMTFKQHLFFNIISIQIYKCVPPCHKSWKPVAKNSFGCCRNHTLNARCVSSKLVRHSENICTQLWTPWREKQCSAFMGSISLWISFASIIFAHKNRTTQRCSILVHGLRGAAKL